MRFSVDAHAIGRKLTGNEVYVRNLLEWFAALDPDSEFIAYLSAEEAARFVPERFSRRRVSPNPFIRLGVDLARQLWRDRPDLLHVQYTAPYACPVPVVVSVHDVSFIEHPEFFTRARALQLRYTVRRTVHAAAKVLAPSEFSRAAILRVYGVEDSRVVVVPCAVSSAFRPLAREAALAKVRERFGICAPFILSVGDLQPRKNQLGLIRAFEELLRRHPEFPHHLVLVGKDTMFASRIHRVARASAAASRIRFTGFVPDEELRELYCACEFFVFPSFYEGFGLPLLEAMACGRAVACSGTSALPEVADAAAILFAPDSTADMVRAMEDLILDEDLRARMERLSIQRAAQFSWERTAEETLRVYYEVAQRKQSQLSFLRRPAAVSHP